MMTPSEFPKVKIDLTSMGRGKVKIDGVEIREVTHIGFEAAARDLTRVTLTLCAGVELTAQEADVVLMEAPKMEEVTVDLPENDAALRDALYLVKNGMAFADVLAMSSDEKRRCARAFAELNDLTLVPEDGMRWKRREGDFVHSLRIDGNRIAAVVRDHLGNYSLSTASASLGVPDVAAA